MYWNGRFNGDLDKKFASTRGIKGERLAFVSRASSRNEPSLVGRVERCIASVVRRLTLRIWILKCSQDVNKTLYGVAVSVDMFVFRSGAYICRCIYCGHVGELKMQSTLRCNINIIPRLFTCARSVYRVASHRFHIWVISVYENLMVFAGSKSMLLRYV